MSTAPIESLPTAERRRLVAIGLLRALANTVLVVAAYYLLPLDNLAGVSLGIALTVGLLALTAVVAYQVRAIIRHPHSAVRAIEALAITVPVFLLLFAATYFMMEQTNPTPSTSIRSPGPTRCTSRSPSSPQSASETSPRPARRPVLSSSRR